MLSGLDRVGLEKIMDDKRAMEQVYKDLYAGMLQKDGQLLDAVLDDSFVLVHMTGMRQTKKQFIEAVLDGTLNYYSAVHEHFQVEQHDDTARVVGQSYVNTAVFGGGRSDWHLQLTCTLAKRDERWNITKSRASIYGGGE